MNEDSLPLMLEECPADVLPIVVADALADLTLRERLTLGSDLPKAVGLRAEAKLSGMDLRELDRELSVDDVALAASIVHPHLT